MAALLQNAEARRASLKAFADRGLALIALNANGNQLQPTDGERQSQVLHNTIRLAGLLGVKEVCLMSGLRAGGPGDRLPNWVVSSWPPETQTILKWQWEERLLAVLAQSRRGRDADALTAESDPGQTRIHQCRTDLGAGDAQK